MLLLPLTIYTLRGDLKLAWDHDGYWVHHYEVKIIRDNSAHTYTYTTMFTDITISKPKPPGIYLVEVRACGTQDCAVAGEWCKSTGGCAKPEQFKVQFVNH